MLLGQRAAREIGGVVGEQQLIDPARRDAAARAVADDGRVLREPERLHRLGEGARWEPRHALAAVGDGLELSAPLRVAGLLRLGSRPRCEPFGEGAHRLRGQLDGREERRFVLGLRARSSCGGLGLDAGEAEAKDVLVAEHDVRLRVGAAAAPLEVVSRARAHRADEPRQIRHQTRAFLHADPASRVSRAVHEQPRQRADAEALGFLPEGPRGEVERARETVRSERGDLRLAHRLALPVGDQLIEQEALVRGLDSVAEALEVLEEVLEEEGEVASLQGERRRDQLRRAVPHQELVGLDAHRHLLEDALERPRCAERRVQALGLLVRFGEVARALHAQPVLGGEEPRLLRRVLGVKRLHQRAFFRDFGFDLGAGLAFGFLSISRNRSPTTARTWRFRASSAAGENGSFPVSFSSTRP